MPGVRLAGICNRASASGEQLAEEFGIERTYRDAEVRLKESAPDAVFIAVSHTATFEVTASVLRSGIPCLIEKPAGYTLEETAYLASRADTYKCLNMVGLNRRFYSTINQALLAVLHQGPVRGVLVEAHEPILEYRSRQDFEDFVYDNWLIANTIHAIDLLRMAGGDVARVQGFGRRINEPLGDSFSLCAEFADGTLGTFVSHWNSARGFGLKIFGEGVVAELWPLEEGFVRYDTGRRIKLRPDWADTQFKPGLYAQNAAFLQAVCDRLEAPFPATSLCDNLKTMQLVEKIAEEALGPAIGREKSKEKTHAWA
jgi:predicted dehydrogenase